MIGFLYRRHRICNPFLYVYLYFSGTVSIAGLTNTTNLTHVKPLIEQNIHKKGYEKAWKEFLDEKCAVHLRSQNVEAIKAKSTTRQTASPTTIAKSNPPTIEPLRSSSRLRYQLQMVKATTAKSATRVNAPSTTAAKSNPTTIEPMRRSNRLRNKLQMVTVTIKKSSTLVLAPSTAAKSDSAIVVLRRSNRLRSQEQKAEALRRGI